ncbi:AraC family transcriptional regulator [Chryseomicrobium aureum]|uniref:GyrI-like domain-containing protein n=1 Tax=Chryseomicrobium aureum TaxID=1441723 RepID=UPI0019591769|nr:GyrI-like domain-containing protein [Chryseomicrobium aureum]MBM7707136.1 putative transcriptional regulator YdeE [Chryseomicrobium aureum]
MPAHKTLTVRSLVTKHKGIFQEYATVVPEKARLFLEKLHDTDYQSHVELALFEPQSTVDQVEGTFFVGILVSEQPPHPPAGMEYMEITRDYAFAKGTIDEIGELHVTLSNWMLENELQFDLTGYIIEMYFPTDKGEEVEIYLPIKTK